MGDVISARSLCDLNQPDIALVIVVVTIAVLIIVAIRRWWRLATVIGRTMIEGSRRRSAIIADRRWRRGIVRPRRRGTFIIHDHATHQSERGRHDQGQA
jgi:hypothetical protein